MNDEVSRLKIQELAYELRIKDAMSHEVHCVTPGDTMSDVRKLLKDKRISGLPVLVKNKIVGIVSIEDFIKSILPSRLENKVKNNMTEDVRVLFSDEPLIHAISIFDKLGYGRFPVVDRDSGKLKGIITKGDIIKCLLKKLEVDYHEEEIQKYRASHIFKDIKSNRTTIILRHKIKGGAYKVAGEQSSYLKVNLLRLGIPPEIARRVVIACCEAEMNIIIFTDGGEIITRVEEDEIKVNAIDKGPGICDVQQAMQEGFSTAPDWVRDMGFGAGMGLPNIKKCTDWMKINSKLGTGTNLEFSVNLTK